MIQVTGDEEEEKEIFKHDSWRVFRIISEFVDGFETMTTLGPSVSIFRLRSSTPRFTVLYTSC